MSMAPALAELHAAHKARRAVFYAPRPAPVAVAVVEPPKPAPPPLVIVAPEPPEAIPAAFNGPRAAAERIIKETADRFGVLVREMKGPRRYHPLADARREAAWLIAIETELSLAEIGRILGKDHTTIINSIRTANERTRSNVRNLGGVPLVKRLRDLESAATSAARHARRRAGQ